MPNPVLAVRHFLSWWTSGLMSCLPERWHDALLRRRAQFDLIISRQGHTIVAVTGGGNLLDTISLGDGAAVDVQDLVGEEQKIYGLSNTQLKATQDLLEDKDPSVSLAGENLDFDLSHHSADPGQSTPDFELGDPAAVNTDDHSSPPLFDPMDGDNVFPMGIQSNGDATIVLEDRDQTTRILESAGDDETFVIKHDQGNLLQFGNAGQNDNNTVFFQSQDGKIRQVVPDQQLSEPLAAPGQSVGVEMGAFTGNADPDEYGLVSRLLQIYQKGKRALYLLPSNRLLEVKLSYPIEAMQNIESVLKFDLEKHIPLAESEVRYFYALSVDSGGERVNADVAVIRSEEYDLLNLTLEPFLRHGVLCTSDSFYRKYGNKINFLEQKDTSGLRAFTGLSSLHLACNWLLFAILLATPYLTFYQGLESIQEESPAKVAQVRELVAELNATNAEVGLRSVLSDQVNRAPRMIDLLAALSGFLNKDAWIYQFTYRDNEIKIKGEAESATLVSDELNSIGIFQSIKFVSSIVKNSRTGKESFELLLILKTDAS